MTRMIEVKVAELEGDLLDCLVAIIRHPEEKLFYNCDGYTLRWHNKPPAYSTSWEMGGLVIGDCVMQFTTPVGGGITAWPYGRPSAAMTGPTHLVAACRSLVQANHGDVVSVPAELAGGV